MPAQDVSAPSTDWITIRRDAETGIESVHAHFQGHAYDAHDHDEMLIGVTQQGVQRFRCNRAQHTSTPGRCILIEPAAVHDGHAPEGVGFTYAMLYLPVPWVAQTLERSTQQGLNSVLPAFRDTLCDDGQLGLAIQQAFVALHQQEGRLARDQGLDGLIQALSSHWVRPDSTARESLPRMLAVRDYLHAQMGRDVGLDELAAFSGTDRFRLTRQFTKAFGQSPHAYLVRLRLRAARKLLAAGMAPAEAATEVGFADQSHLGRWFQRAYRLSPAAYQRSARTF